VKEIIEYACENDCNYIGINFPLDNCNRCGYIGRIAEDCPCCGSPDVKRLRRVSGYLAEVDRFVKGKKFSPMGANTPPLAAKTSQDMPRRLLRGILLRFTVCTFTKEDRKREKI
jgi:hypothetical protein